MKNLILIFISIFFTSSLVFAQTGTTRHPRVMELEKSLTKESLDFLKGRFPKHPFLVTVAVDPIFRTNQEAKKETEALPFFDQSSEEILDEWDDPAQTSSSLMKRAKKILVTVSIPASLTEDEISEIQQSLMNNLGLFPARDGVEIRKRNWTVEEDKNNNWTYVGWGAAVWVLIMVGLMAVAWPSVSRLVKALKDSNKEGKGSAAVIQQAPAPTPSGGIGGSGSNKPTQISGDLKFSDPIKYREMISHIVTILKNNKHFPILEDMILFDRFGQQNPGGLGAVLAEFPIEIKKKLFSYSFGSHWLEALAQPSELDSKCLDVYLKLIRIHRADSNMETELLLINTWRLDNKRVDYIKSMTSAQAMSLLAQMPKDIGVKTAKEAFPGNWGALLDPHFKPVQFDQATLTDLMQKAEKLTPYRDYSSLELYKREKDLIEYVRIADVATEREIYTATPKDSFLHLMRPPFFKVLDMEAEVLDYLVPKYSIDDWAQVCFNVPKPERREIEKRLNEKQKYRFFELMKQMDGNPLDPVEVGSKREAIAKEAAATIIRLKNKKDESPNNADNDEQQDDSVESTETAA